MPRRSRPGRWLSAALLAVVACAPARGDVVFLKDGTILQGKLHREAKQESDPATGEPYRFAAGFFFIDDGPRRVVFCQSQVVKFVQQEEGTSEVRIAAAKKWATLARPTPPIQRVLGADPFDARWDRTIHILTPLGDVHVPQHLSLLTPLYAKVDALKRYTWANYYLTRELGPEMVQGLLATNPACADDPKLKEDERVARRFRVCDFYAQTGWYDLAERDLAKLAADFPAQKDQAEASRQALRKARAREQLELIKRLQLAGRYRAVKVALDAFPEKEASEETAAEFRSFKAAFDESAENYADTVRALDAVAAGLADAPKELKEALAAVRAEVHPDRASRLEAFLGQARQAERQRKAGRKPDGPPATLASLAVTGFLLGGPSADPKPEVALRLWRSRRLLVDYLRADDAAVREKLLAGYERRKDDYASLDELCQMIPQLPPEAPSPDTKDAETELRAGDGRSAPLYLVKLPPEYSHNRPYPVLLALPGTGEMAQQALQRYADLCAENGYVLAVPRGQERSGDYAFGERGHAEVLEVLRDLRRRFQVDSDRVFLTGAGGGGDMAFDVGLSHPDEFAGVLPMSAGPAFFSEAYWRSAQYLPFYVVTGDRTESYKKLREQFNNWVGRNFNALWVQYKGRGVEWFPGEMPAAFDWMRNKRRAFPLHQLGTDGLGGPMGSEFYTMRQGDNRFYWLSTDEVVPACCNSVEGWSNRVSPARLTARIDPATNEITVRARGVRQVTVWLGRNAKGEGMIDFEKPLTVLVNMGARWSNRRVAPSLGVLLQDLADRGDRQRLLLARIATKL